MSSYYYQAPPTQGLAGLANPGTSVWDQANAIKWSDLFGNPGDPTSLFYQKANEKLMSLYQAMMADPNTRALAQDQMAQIRRTWGNSRSIDPSGATAPMGLNDNSQVGGALYGTGGDGFGGGLSGLVNGINSAAPINRGNIPGVNTTPATQVGPATMPGTPVDSPPGPTDPNGVNTLGQSRKPYLYDQQYKTGGLYGMSRSMGNQNGFQSPFRISSKTGPATNNSMSSTIGTGWGKGF